MSHVILSGWGSTGDITPLVAVGAALRQRGHAVDFVGSPYFAALAAGAGLTLLPIGDRADHEALMADPGVFGANRRSWQEIYAAHYFPRLGDFHRVVSAAIRPDTMAILGDEVGAAAAAEQHGVPRVRVAPSSPRFASHYDPPHPEAFLPAWSAWCARSATGLALLYRIYNLRRGRLRWPRVSSEWPSDHPIATFRRQHGLPAVTQSRAALTLCLWPEWFAPPQPDWPKDAVVTGFPMYPPPVTTTAGGASAPRPIVATTGTIAGAQTAFFEKVVAACRQVERPAVLVSPHADHIPRDLPQGIRYLAHAPFNELLGQASLVIHHGGIGTSAYAIGAGIPQVIVPMRGDQFDNGNRLVRLGVARMVSGERTTGEELARTVDGLLTSARVARQCRRWQSRLDPGEGLRRAADYVEALGRSDNGSSRRS